MKPSSVRSIFWAGSEAAFSAAFSFAGALVIARLVGPSEFGVGAAAVVVHVLLWVTVNALFADALVQCATLTDDAASSAFWASTLAGVFVSILQACSGGLLASALHDSRLQPMCLMLALPLPLVGAGGVVQGLLTRRRAYRALAGRALIGQGLGVVAGTAAALHGAGAWAPVLQQAVGSSAGALTLLLRARWRPHAVWRGNAVTALLRVGAPLTVSTLVQTARYRLFAVALGGIAGSTTLGETHMAFRLVDTVRELSFTALWRLILPVLSERQDDIPALRAMCDRMVRLVSAAMLPVCGVMFLAIGPMTGLLLGPAWHAASRATAPLVTLMAVQCVMFPAGAAVIARGQTGRALAANIASLVCTVAGVALLTPGNAVQAAVVWVAAQAAVLPYMAWINGQAVGASALRPLRAAAPACAAALAGVACATALSGPASGGIAQLAQQLGTFLCIAGAATLPVLRATGWTGPRQ